MKFLKILMLILTVSAPSLAKAEAARDGNHLLKACSQIITRQSKDPKELMDAAACGGMLRGAAEINDLYRAALSDKGDKGLFCPPEGVTSGQTIRIVVKYLEEHPEELHEQESLLIVKALSNAFPCSGDGR